MECRLLARGDELGAIRWLLDEVPPAGLGFVGEPGIGRSALLECGARIAAESGHRVLLAHASEDAKDDHFGVLADLLVGVDPDTTALEAPLRKALAGALLREEMTGPLDTGATVRGALQVLAAMAEENPLLVAVDDVQWCDPESIQVLAGMARQGLAIRCLLTRRSRHPMTAVESALRRRELAVIEVSGLGKEEIGHLLNQRLRVVLPRWISGRIAEHSRGNPLLALEFGRMIRQRGIPDFGAPLAVPGDLEDLLARRIEDLPTAQLELLLATAAEPLVSDSDLTKFGDVDALDEALAAHLLVADPGTGQVRPVHPMLGAAAWAAATPTVRRRTHRRLADVLPGDDLALRHRAHGCEGPDDSLAGQLDPAVTRAADAGRTESAAELARLALHLSSPTSSARPSRVLTLAHHLAELGAGRDLTALLDRELPGLPRGEIRARAWLLATEGELESADQVLDHLDHAIAEAEALPSLRAECLSTRAAVLAVVRARGIREAVHAGDEAIALDPASSLGASWARAMAGLPDPVTVDDRGTASRHSWRGDVSTSRQLLADRIADAERSGDHGDFLLATMLLSEVELRAGCLDRAAALVDLADASGYEDLFETPDVARCRARLAALRGDVEESHQWIAQARSAAEAAGSGWIVLDLMVTEGLARTCAGELDRAATCFGEVWDWCRREGIENPGALPVALELVAARLGVEDVDGAREVVSHLVDVATAQQNPWGLAISRPAVALVRLQDAAGEPCHVADAATRAARELEEMGCSFDAARVRAIAGTFLRRRRQWGSARQLLGDAVADFRSIGATGWITPVELELAKVGGRRSSAGSLTPAELSTAQMAATGLSNQQIAHRTATSVRTVEAHLTRAYAKLAVTTRRQLPAALAVLEETQSQG